MSLEAVMEKTEANVAASTTAPATTTAVEEPNKALPGKDQSATATTIATETPSTAQTEVVDQEPDLETSPEGSGDYEKFKKVFESHPELKSELKQIIGREKAFSELAPDGSFSQMREILQRIPTIEDAETLTEQAENAKAFGETFRGDRAAFVESLRESDPLAFQALAAELPDILAQTDEKLYAEQARAYTNRVLSNTLAIAQHSGDKEFLAAVQLVAQYLGVQPGSVAPRMADNSEAARLRKQLEERDRSDASQAADSFWSSTDEVIISNGTAEVERTVKQALPNATQKQLERISIEIWNKTLATLNAQPQFRQQIDQYRKAAYERGRVGIADHKAIVDFGTRRAKLVIPKVAREVISEWSKEVLQLSKENLTKKEAIASSTKDVGSGPQGTTSAAAATTNGNAKPRSMESIFGEIESRNYVKR